MKVSRGAAAVALAAGVSLVLAIVAPGAASGPHGAGPAGHRHERSHVPMLFSLFTDNPLLGGQVAPRQYRWVNGDVLIFVQFDRSRPDEAKALRYIGISVKGTFCGETQPDGAKGAFTHFHRLTAPTYGAGHGGPPGEQGYWLMWVATDAFEAADKRQITPGVDYGFSPTPAPACNGTPKAEFSGPGAHTLSAAEIKSLAAAFPDNPLRGGQTAPRVYRWVTGDTAIFLEFDKAAPTKAKALRYIGVATRGKFCSADRPSADFTYFQRLNAKTYAKGKGGKAGVPGLWHLFVATDTFRMPWGQVTPGVDRKFSPTPPPDCPKA